MPEIPESWEWVTVDVIAAMVEYGISESMNEKGPGVPILRIPNIVPGQLLFEKLKYLPFGHEKFPELLLQPGDVLFNRTNSPELVGKTAVYHEGDPKPCTFASYLIRVKPIDFDPDLLASFINSPFGEVWLSEVRSQQVGQANVNGTKLKELRIPLMPSMEQRKIAQKIRFYERKFQVLTACTNKVEQNLAVLRESLLARIIGHQHESS